MIHKIAYLYKSKYGKSSTVVIEDSKTPIYDFDGNVEYYMIRSTEGINYKDSELEFYFYVDLTSSSF
jgi:hypothetical protein